MKKIFILGAHLDNPVIVMGGAMAEFVQGCHGVNVFYFGNGGEKRVLW